MRTLRKIHLQIRKEFWADGDALQIQALWNNIKRRIEKKKYEKHKRISITRVMQKCQCQLE